MGEKNIVVQPAGRTEDPGARLWQIWLAVLLLGGTLLSFWDSWVDLGIAPVLPACLGTAALALSMAAGWLRERDRRLDRRLRGRGGCGWRGRAGRAVALDRVDGERTGRRGRLGARRP